MLSNNNCSSLGRRSFPSTIDTVKLQFHKLQGVNFGRSRRVMRRVDISNSPQNFELWLQSTQETVIRGVKQIAALNIEELPEKLRTGTLTLDRDRRYWPAGILVAGTLLFPLLVSGRIMELFENKVFMAGIISCFAAQAIKVFSDHCKCGTWDISSAWAFRGCPSSRTALCVGITSALAATVGLASPLFAAAFSFSTVVMGDSMGLCWHVGLHAHVLNRIINKIKEHHPLSSMEATELKEVLGHTPAQVFFGACIGLIVGTIYPRISF